VGVASVGDNGDDGDVPSVSLGFLVLAFVVVVASVLSRTISKGGEKEKGRGRCVSCIGAGSSANCRRTRE
jgi:hypothetical protein